MTPKTIATSDARIGAIGNGMSHCIASFDSENPATPANAIWASDGLTAEARQQHERQREDRGDRRGHDGAAPERIQHEQADRRRHHGHQHAQRCDLGNGDGGHLELPDRAAIGQPLAEEHHRHDDHQERQALTSTVLREPTEVGLHLGEARLHEADGEAGERPSATPS